MKARWLMSLAVAAPLAGGCRCADSEPPPHPLEVCTRTLSSISTLPPEQIHRWPDLYGQGCGGIYRQPRCRSAWLEPTQESQLVRTSRIIVTCANEYCPTLPEPRPAMCSMQLDHADPVELTQHWPELHAQILGNDLGVPADAGAVLALNRLFMPATVRLELPDAAPAAPAVVLRVRQAGAKVEVAMVADGGEQRWTVPANPSDADLEALARELKAQGPTAESRAVVEASGEVSYGAVMKVLDTAKSAGYVRIAMSVARATHDE